MRLTCQLAPDASSAVAKVIAGPGGRGMTWARIGAALQITRQSAWERFSGEE
jgi:hypothetical protein